MFRLEKNSLNIVLQTNKKYDKAFALDHSGQYVIQYLIENM